LAVILNKIKGGFMSRNKWSPERSFFPTISNWMYDFFPDNSLKMLDGASTPAVNIVESNSDYKLSIAAPGFKKDDFKVQVRDGLLMISGERGEENLEEDERYTRREYAYSAFNRSFSVPENTEGDGVLAEYVDGVLQVKLPKKKTAEKPTIQISVK
jgi:HSP20 family protein